MVVVVGGGVAVVVIVVGRSNGDSEDDNHSGNLHALTSLCTQRLMIRKCNFLLHLGFFRFRAVHKQGFQLVAVVRIPWNRDLMLQKEW